MRYKILVLLSLVITLSGCVAGVISQGDLTYLRQGMSPREVGFEMNNRAQNTFPVKVYGRHYLVQKYELANGNYNSNYYLAYNNRNHLIYWGYLNEFARSHNGRINELGRQIIAHQLDGLNQRMG